MVMQFEDFKYYKYDDEWIGIEDAVTYVETARGGEIRRITYTGKIYLASNIILPNGSMNLADTGVEYDQYDDVTPITKSEFYEVWNAHLAIRQTEWNLTKQKYPIGATVKGLIYMFPPLGVIVTVDNNAIGVADYVACKGAVGPEAMYPKTEITATVIDYDEQDQWLVLSTPQLYSDRARSQ